MADFCFNARGHLDGVKLEGDTNRERIEKVTPNGKKTIVCSKSIAGFSKTDKGKCRLGFLTKGSFTFKLGETETIVASDKDVGCVYAIVVKADEEYTISSGCDAEKLKEMKTNGGNAINPQLRQDGGAHDGMRRMEFFNNEGSPDIADKESGVYIYRWDDPAEEKKCTHKAMKGTIDEVESECTNIRIFHTPLGDVMMLRVAKGWQWEKCIKPHAGTDNCKATHCGYAWKGEMLYKPVGEGREELKVTGGHVYFFDAEHHAEALEECCFVEFNSLWQTKA